MALKMLGGCDGQVLPGERPLAWLLQVMPFFFLVGGYANAAWVEIIGHLGARRG